MPWWVLLISVLFTVFIVGTVLIVLENKEIEEKIKESFSNLDFL